MASASLSILHSSSFPPSFFLLPLILAPPRANTDPFLPGFWMTLVAFVILLLAGCTVCFGRRRQRMSSATAYPMTEARAPFWKRAFKRN